MGVETGKAGHGGVSRRRFSKNGTVVGCSYTKGGGAMNRIVSGFRLLLIGALGSTWLASAQPADAASNLVIYTAANEKLHADVVTAFSKKYPDITVKAVNLSTGPITEKAIAEKNNPQADLIYAVNTVALEQLKNAGALEPYAPKDSKIPGQFADSDGFYINHWLTVMV